MALSQLLDAEARVDVPHADRHISTRRKQEIARVHERNATHLVLVSFKRFKHRERLHAPQFNCHVDAARREGRPVRRKRNTIDHA